MVIHFLEILYTKQPFNVDKFQESAVALGMRFRKFVKNLPMALRMNAPTLTRLEKMIEEAGYVLRYERGTFQSGYCILESRKVVVLNKFLQTEGRINTLVDLLPILTVHVDTLSPENRKLYEEVMAEPASDK
jgi:hypothetical protein